jgi:hypothetical protein
MSSNSSSSGVSKVTLGMVAVIIVGCVAGLVLQITGKTNDEIRVLRDKQATLAQELNSAVKALDTGFKDVVEKWAPPAPASTVKADIDAALKTYMEGFKTTLEVNNKKIEAKLAAAEEARKDGDKAKEKKELDQARETQKKLEQMQQQVGEVVAQVKANPGELPKVPLPIPDVPETSPDDSDRATKAVIGMALAAFVLWNPALAGPAMLLGAILGIGGSTETRQAVVEVARAVATNGSVDEATIEMIKRALEKDGQNPNIVIPLRSMVGGLRSDKPENRRVQELVQEKVKALGDDWKLSDDATAVRKALENGNTAAAVAALPRNKSDKPYYRSESVKTEVQLVCIGLEKREAWETLKKIPVEADFGPSPAAPGRGAP